MSEVTRIMSAIEQGDPQAAAQLLPLVYVDLAAPESPDEVLALDEAIHKLAAQHKAAADLVRLRFYAGLPLPEVAKLLGISPRTADRLWAFARAWLHQELQGRGAKGELS